MIKITEIMPNPKGADGDNEWIELKNISGAEDQKQAKEPLKNDVMRGNKELPTEAYYQVRRVGSDEVDEAERVFQRFPKAINLENYVLDDIEGGSKPYKLPAIILQPDQTVVLYKSQTKINLNNSGDEVRIFSPEGTLLDKVSYGKTKEGLSYSLIEILSKKGKTATYDWVNPTPNTKNPTFYILEGEITSEPEIKTDFSFGFKPYSSTENTKSVTVTFSQETLSFETAKLILKPRTEAKLLTSKITNSKFSLIDYKITKSAKPETSTEITETGNKIKPSSPESLQTSLITIAIPALAILIILAFKTMKLKKREKQVYL